MERTLAVIAAVVLALTVTLARADEEKPDATITLEGGSVAAGLGVSWGKGTLTYQGKEYPISVTGISIGALGVTTLDAEGRVYGLKKLEDFDGNYAAVGAEATVAGGSSVVTMKNANGVRVNMGARTKGVKVSLGAGGVDMKIKQ